MSRGKVLVTGGAGFIGSHLVDRLLQEGYTVRVLDNLSKPTHDGVPSYLSKEAEFIEGDVSNSRDIDKALEGVSGVFHLAAKGGFTSAIAEYAKSNSLGTAVLMEGIAQKRKVEKIVVASSVGVYGEGSYLCNKHGCVYPALRTVNALSLGQWEQRCPICGGELSWTRTPESKPIKPETIYSISKFDQERIVLAVARELGIRCAALRLFLTYGPRQSLRNPYTGICSIFASQWINGVSPRIFEDGHQLRDFIYVGDVVNASMLVYENQIANGRVFNVGTGKPTEILQMAKMIAKLLNRNGEPRVDGEFRLGEVRHIVADVSLLQGLGFKTTVDLEEGIGRYLNWVESQGRIEDYFSRVYSSLIQDRVIRKATMNKVCR